MPEDVADDSGRPPNDTGRPLERFTALFAADRAALLEAFARRIERPHGPVAARPQDFNLAIRTGDQIIADVLTELRERGSQIDDHHPMLITETDYSLAGSQLNTTDLLRVTAELSSTTMRFIARYVNDEPELLPCFISTVLALNDNISRRIREATIAHVSLLLDRIDQAHIDERERIARDLHDQLGEGLAAALRQLELCEIGGPDDPEAQFRLSLAKGTLTGAINRLRAVMSGLRQDSVRSLEKALVQYIDATATEADVRLRVSGDETWAPASVIEEAFLIVREAIRNALRHGAPKSVQIGVVFAPHEIHAWVEDDGRGLGPAPDTGRSDTEHSGTGRSGTGLASMRERASLIGGRLTIASVQDQGTSVELLVPLSGHPDDQRK